VLADAESFLVKICDFGLAKIACPRRFTMRNGSARRSRLLGDSPPPAARTSARSTSPAVPSESTSAPPPDVIMRLCRRFGDASCLESLPPAAAPAVASSGACSPHGLAVASEPRLVMRSIVGSQWYASPELLTECETYDESVDVWGLGLIVHILLTGAHPFEGTDMYGAIMAAHVTFSEGVWGGLCPSVRHLIRGCLAAEPSDRLTAAQVVRHEWISQGEAKGAPLSVALADLRQCAACFCRYLPPSATFCRLL
jgi:serine/threonine protein kinase